MSTYAEQVRAAVDDVGRMLNDRMQSPVLVVCRWCYSTNLAGAKHGTSVSDGTPDGGQVACLWPCRHEVLDRENECGYCNPPTESPF